MLSCWNEIPQQRPSFSELKTSIDSMLLADRKGDYIDFSLDVSLMKPFNQNEDGEGSLSATSSLHFLNMSSVGKGHSSCESVEAPENTIKLLLNADTGSNSGCVLGPSTSNNSSIRENELPSPRQCSPAGNNYLSPPLPSGKQGQLQQCSPIRLFSDHQSPGSQSSSNQLSFTSSGNFLGEELMEASRLSEHPRPMSFLLSMEREQRKLDTSDRYVKEPTKLANRDVIGESNLSAGAGIVQQSMISTQSRTNTEPVCILRRGSDGALNVNRNGYVSLMERHSSNDIQPNHQPPKILIEETEDM